MHLTPEARILSAREYDPTAWERFADTDHLRSVYEQTGWTGYRLRNRLALEKAIADCGPGPMVLDVGCFIGSYAEPVLAARARYTGVDITPKFIAAARERHPGLSFWIGDIRNLPLPDRSFDIVLSFGTLIHLPDVVEPLAELWRVSRKILLVETTTVREAPGPVDLQEEAEHFIARAYSLAWFGELVRALAGSSSESDSQYWRDAESSSGPTPLSSSLWRIERT